MEMGTGHEYRKTMCETIYDFLYRAQTRTSEYRSFWNRPRCKLTIPIRKTTTYVVHTQFDALKMKYGG